MILIHSIIIFLPRLQNFYREHIYFLLEKQKVLFKNSASPKWKLTSLFLSGFPSLLIDWVDFQSQPPVLHCTDVAMFLSPLVDYEARGFTFLTTLRNLGLSPDKYLCTWRIKSSYFHSSSPACMHVETEKLPCG